jgi:glycosyltransferase involved in cell wall biosynthesis
MREKLIAEHGFHTNSISVIHNGIAIPKNQPFRKKKPMMVGSAGRMFPVKDFKLLVEIASKVITVMDDVDFVIAGNGPQSDLLQERIVSHGLTNRFCLPGHIHEMDTFYQDLDIYINTSVHEGIPMSVLEAMSHGLPVVAPNVGGFPEIVEEGVTGYLIDNRDPSMFAARCIELLSDTEKRKHMARAARQRVVDHFSREAMVKMYYQLYQKVLG